MDESSHSGSDAPESWLTASAVGEERRRASGLWKDSDPGPLIPPPPPAAPILSPEGVLQNLPLQKLSLSVMNHVLPSHPRIHPQPGERLTFPSLRQGERFKNLERSIGAQNVLMLHDVSRSFYGSCFVWGGSFASVARNGGPAWSSAHRCSCNSNTPFILVSCFSIFQLQSLKLPL